MSRNGWRKSTSISRKCSSSENRWGVFSYINITASPLYYKLLHLSVFWKMLYLVPHCSIVFLKSSRPSLFDKAGCTRQFESELSLRSLASLFPIKKGIFRIPPSPFSQRELHFLPKPLFLRKRGCNRPTRCSEPLRSKVGGPSKVFAMLCGMGPPYYNLLLVFAMVVRDGTAWE